MDFYCNICCTVQVSIELTHVTIIKPMAGPCIVAYIARKDFPGTVWRENELELVMMGLVIDIHWQCCAKYMKICKAYFAMVAEALALLPARITVKEAFSITGSWEEIENMVFVERVSDLLRHF